MGRRARRRRLGSRLLARRLRDATRPGAGADDVVLSGRPVAIGPTGSDAADVVRDLLDRLRATVPALPTDGVAAAAVGATGLASLVRDPAELHAALRTGLPPAEGFATDGDPSARPGPRTAVAADALTAHLGALGGRPGAVVAVGTGAIALGTDLRTVWHRVDGWGHLLGDLGSGSWVGAQGLRAAVAAHDGRDSGGSTALLAAAVARFGPVPSWPGQLYTRPDRAQVLASFTPTSRPRPAPATPSRGRSSRAPGPTSRRRSPPRSSTASAARRRDRRGAGDRSAPHRRVPGAARRAAPPRRARRPRGHAARRRAPARRAPRGRAGLRRRSRAVAHARRPRRTARYHRATDRPAGPTTAEETP